MEETILSNIPAAAAVSFTGKDLISIRAEPEFIMLLHESPVILSTIAEYYAKQVWEFDGVSELDIYCSIALPVRTMNEVTQDILKVFPQASFEITIKNDDCILGSIVQEGIQGEPTGVGDIDEQEEDDEEGDVSSDAEEAAFIQGASDSSYIPSSEDEDDDSDDLDEDD